MDAADPEGERVPPPAPRPGPEAEPPLVPLGEAWRAWAEVALHSFGGPAGQIAVMHRVLVEERRWISEERFLHALNYCMLLPGPEAQQLATYVGWLLHRTPGALLAGGLFVAPGFLAILALSYVYVLFGEVGLVIGVFAGLKPAVFAIVVQALVRIGRRVLHHRAHLAIAAAAFAAIFFLQVRFPWVVLGGALAGVVVGRGSSSMGGHGPGAAGTPGPPPDSIAARLDARPPEHTRPSVPRALRVAAVCLALWLLPLLAIRLGAGPDSHFTLIGEFFSKAAVVTFGGAYAVLTYVAQQAVETYAWLQPGEMLDGLGMAETTPGPLIMVVQFVGFMGAWRFPGGLDPLPAATLGALLATWVTFVPCFLWILVGAPWVEALRRNRVLAAAFTGITAAVVGVILNLAVWFGLHTLFADVGEAHTGIVRWFAPPLEGLRVPALVIALLALWATFRGKAGMFAVLGGAALLGVAGQWLGA